MTEKYGSDELAILLKENSRLHERIDTLRHVLGRAIFHARMHGWGTGQGHELAEVFNQMVNAVKDDYIGRLYD